MSVITEIGFGEFLDKFTIAVNKFYNCPKGEDVLQALLELARLLESTPMRNDSIRKELEAHADASLAKALLEIRVVNQELWSLEERVRVEKDPDTRLILSDSIRCFNRDRSSIKKSIGTIFRDVISEVKDYATRSK